MAARRVAKKAAKPAKKRASSSKAQPQALSPQQKAANTRRANREAAEALLRKRQAAAAKAAETRAETARVVEKGSRAKLTRAETAFLEERSKKCRSQAVCASIYAALAFQEAREEAKGPTQRIKELLVKLRREAIDNKVGWYPSKLANSSFPTEARPKPGATWREERTSPMYVPKEDDPKVRQLEDVTFGYNRRHERVGRVLTNASADEINKQIAERYNEMIKDSNERAPFTRGFIQVYGYTIAADIDDSLVKAYAEFVRLRPPQRHHEIGRGDVGTGPIIQEDPQHKLVLLTDSGAISPIAQFAVEGAQEAINRWLTTLDKSIIVDSFFISIEERPFAKKKGDAKTVEGIQTWLEIDKQYAIKRDKRRAKARDRYIARAKAKAARAKAEDDKTNKPG